MSIDAGSNAAGEAGTGKLAFKVARGSGTPANDAAERPGEAGQLMKPLVWPPGAAVSTVVAAHGQERAGLAAAALPSLLRRSQFHLITEEPIRVTEVCGLRSFGWAMRSFTLCTRTIHLST